MARPEDLPQETLGLRLLLARTRMRWTLAELSAETNITESMLSRYERDKALPSTDRLIRLARALGTTPNDLLDFGGTRA
jgi:transcriptional regulator with XRE-family HTH domain